MNAGLTTPRGQMLDWIFQVNEKAWATREDYR